MDLHNKPAYTRREFLGSSLAMASAAMTVPAFVNASAFGLPMPALGMSSIPGVDEDKILVIVQLSGGNDGLNTVVPFGDDQYYRGRSGIAIPRDQVGKLGGKRTGGIGLHPALDSVRELYDEGLMTIIQGVGYPNPNRSHFKSMDIWHTADTSGTGDGWLGRYIDAQCCGYGKGESGQAETPPPVDAGQLAIALGREAPLALQGRKSKPISFETADLFRWIGKDVHESLEGPYATLNREALKQANAANNDDHSTASFLMRTALNAQVSSEQIRKAVDRQPAVAYPQTKLGQDLSMIAGMIGAGLKTRVFYATHGSFDTHAGQGAANGRHANLLRQFSDAVAAFYADLKKQGQDQRVLTMTFSEFGRRVGQNASGGTDHGTAAPMFFFGPMVNPGVLGNHPSLQDLDNGDLKHSLDFRSVYATVLEDWLTADSRKVLERSYRKISLLAKS